MSAIDVGAEAIDRSVTYPAVYTYVDLNNPANASGILTSIEIWAQSNMTGLRVGTFYLVSGTDYKCRASQWIGAVTAGSKQIFPVQLAVVSGDFIGCYFATGTLEANPTTFSGVMVVSGEYIDPDDSTTYTLYPGDAISLKGIGITETTICRIAFDSAPYAAIPIWTDVTSDLRGFSFKKGRQHALDRMEAATITVTLGNDHYNYYPNNAVGDYSPNVLPGKRLNILKVYGGIVYEIFTGYITDYQPDWLGSSGLGAIMRVTAVGLLGNLARLQMTDTYAASDDLLWSSDAQVTSTSTTYVKLKELTCGGNGQFRIAFDLAGLVANGYGKIYRNGVAVGTERTNTSPYVTFSEDLAGWVAGDLIQIYGKNDVGGEQLVYIRNFRIYGAYAGFPQELSGARVERVLDKLSTNIGHDLAVGQITMQASGTTTVAVNALSHLATVQQSELGYIFEAGDGDLQYHDSATRLSAPYTVSQAIFSDGKTNLLSNPGFETGDPPTGWTLGGAGATWARSTEQVKSGTYSGKLTRIGADCACYQSIASYASYKGRTVTFGCWVYATISGKINLRTYDGVTYSDSSFHSGSGQWEWLTIAITVDVNATELTVFGYMRTTNTSAYFDDATLVGSQMRYIDVELSYDDKFIYNDIRIQNVGGVEQVAVDATSQTAYGQRSLSRTGLLMTTDAIALVQATTLLAKYKDPALRAKSMTVYPDAFPTTLYPVVLGYDIGRRVTVQLTQAGIDEDYHIEGINQDWDAQQNLWKTKWQLSKAT